MSVAVWRDNPHTSYVVGSLHFVSIHMVVPPLGTKDTLIRVGVVASLALRVGGFFSVFVLHWAVHNLFSLRLGYLLGPNIPHSLGQAPYVYKSHTTGLLMAVPQPVP